MLGFLCCVGETAVNVVRYHGLGKFMSEMSRDSLGGKLAVEDKRADESKYKVQTEADLALPPARG